MNKKNPYPHTYNGSETFFHHLTWMEIIMQLIFSPPCTVSSASSCVCVCVCRALPHCAQSFHFGLAGILSFHLEKNFNFLSFKSILPNVIIFVSSHSKPIIKFYIITYTRAHTSTVFKSWIGIVQASYCAVLFLIFFSFQLCFSTSRSLACLLSINLCSSCISYK